jgi:uncharacterized protein YdhG (YjbR/CyaY superfamily)
MTYPANSPEEYISIIPEDKKEAISKLREIILNNIPDGYQETMSYGMIGYVVPKTIYPNGYHCDTKLPLPFISIAAQKNHISLYHLGIYANQEILNWFVSEYSKVSKTKLDIGKGCIRFKKTENIPFQLIEELVKKISVQEWINTYETNIKPNK